ncbi:MAG: hypothetical protein JNJ50_12605, partial [Acidobacteria bacterium]|nr:hypothetical protein [Acidobacteriota bacterium]
MNWQLWRQDDNGQRFLIEEFATEDAAKAALRQFESLKHKQTYWLQELASSAPDTHTEQATTRSSIRLM